MKSRESFVKGEINLIKKYWIILVIIVNIPLLWILKKVLKRLQNVFLK